MRQAVRTGRGSSAILRALLLATALIGPASFAGAEQSAVPAPSLDGGPSTADPAAGNGIPVRQAQDTTLPKPAPAIDPPVASEPGPGSNGAGDQGAKPGVTADSNIPDGPSEVIRDLSTLPEPVKKMRDQLIAAAASGDPEKLRALLGTGPNQTLVMNTDGDDPVDTLKTFSGDPDGQEILAIMIDILSTGAARFDAGKPDEIYIWPYFVAKNVETLTPPERVDLLRIVTAGDLIGMQDNGNYNFYRLGITPDGQWKFLTGGD